MRDALKDTHSGPEAVPTRTAARGSPADLVTGLLCATGLAAAGWAAQLEPLGLALWCVTSAVLLLPLAWDAPSRRIAWPGYIAAGIVLSLVVTVTGGWQAGIVVAAVAGSLVGGASLLTTLRLPVVAAIAVTILGAAASFTWPIWAADLLTRVDVEPWLQWVINVSPAFALNAAIAPDDPLTHRPLAYRLMNLGQDVNYAMPTSVWPCVALHAAVGLLGRGLTRMNAGGRRATGPACHPEEA